MKSSGKTILRIYEDRNGRIGYDIMGNEIRSNPERLIGALDVLKYYVLKYARTEKVAGMSINDVEDIRKLLDEGDDENES